jgi:hypothetical protein
MHYSSGRCISNLPADSGLASASGIKWVRSK